jgi:hypothetical protein
MSTPIAPIEPSTYATQIDPYSITNLTKLSEEQKKQASADTKYDVKTKVYENFLAQTFQDRAMSIAASWAVAAVVLYGVSFILPKRKFR